MRTHYGFENRNAQQLGTSVTGDFVAITTVTMHGRLKYDQAGLFVYFTDDNWLKTSCEYIPGGPHKLGAVATQHGFSDWSTCPVAGADDGLTLSFRVARIGEAFLVHTRKSDDEPWFLARLARLPVDPMATPATVGLYACNPTGDGGHAVFKSLEIRAPLEGEVTLH